MKTQIKFQKILFLVTLILAALSLVYGFAFCTGSLSYAFAARSGQFSAPLRKDPIGADALFTFVIGKEYVNNTWTATATGFNDLIVILGVVFVVLAALQFFFATNSRRNYYITNYISVGVLAVFGIVLAAIGFWGVARTESLFGALDFERYKSVYDGVTTAKEQIAQGMPNVTVPIGWEKYSDSHAIFIIGYILYAVVIVDAVMLVLNTVWKTLLMKGEKALLAQGAATPLEENKVEEAVNGEAV